MSETNVMRSSHQRRVVGGVAYTLIGNYLVRFINLGVTVMLARYVGSEGMGIVAAALITLEVIDTIRDFGLRDALIHKPDLDDGYATTGFAVIQIISLFQALTMASAGWFGPTLGLSPDVAGLLPWLALIFPMSALASPQEAMLQRHGLFGRRAIAELMGVSLKLLVAFMLLQLGWGIHSMIAAMIAGVALRTLCIWYFSDWRPKFSLITRKAIRPLLGFGKHIIAVNILALCRTKGDQFLVAAFLGSSALGFYFLAARIPEIVIFGVNVAISTVAFPTFSRILREGGSLNEAYLRTVRASILMMAPAAVGIAAISDQIVPVLFGEGWGETARVLAILGLGGIPLTLGWTAGDVFKATGRPHLLTAVTLIELSVALPVIAATVLLTRDLTRVAMAMVACETFSAILRFYFMARFEKTPILSLLRGVAPILLAAALMGAAVLAFAAFATGLPPLPRLIASVLVGALVYCGAIFLLDQRSVGELKAVLQKRA